MTNQTLTELIVTNQNQRMSWYDWDAFTEITEKLSINWVGLAVKVHISQPSKGF